jgi:putative endonuclease
MGARVALNEACQRVAIYVYMLECADGSYYVGTTRAGLDERVAEHNAGKYDGYTKSRRTVRLVFSQECQQITDAIAAERQIKGWSRRKKQALIAGDFDALSALARNYTQFPRD